MVLQHLTFENFEYLESLCCSTGMRWLVVVASLWLVMTLILSDAQARNKPLNHDGGAHQGKRKKDGHGKTFS